jgi:uncharacterized FlaG/YvyC family protein
MDAISPTLIATGTVVPATLGVSAVAPEGRSFNQLVSRAARILNEANFAGQNREITFSIDPGTRRPVIKVVDATTNEIIQQWPSEYLLQLAEQFTSEKRYSG